MRGGDRDAAAAGDRSVGRVGRSAAGVLAATAVGLALTFLTYVVVARTLGPDGRGVVAVLQTNAVLAASFLGLGVPWALYYFSGRSREPQPALLGLSLLHAAALAFVSVALAASLGPVLAAAQDVPDEALYWIAAALVPATFLEYSYVDMLRARRRFYLANVILVGGRALGLVTAVALLAWLNLGVGAALVAILVASTSQVLSALPSLARRGIALSRAVAREVRRYGLRVQGASISRLLSRRFDVLVLSLFAPAATVGQYAVAQSLAELALLVPQAFGLALSPLIIAGQAGAPITQRMIRLNGTVALAVVAILAATAPWSVVLAFGEDFKPAVVPLLILLPGVWLFACGEMASHVLAARGRPGTASLLSMLQAGLTIALDLALVPAYGIDGAAVASAISYSAYGLVSLAVIGRQDDIASLRLLVGTPGEVGEDLRRLRGTLAPR